jgi:hypothetical protein
MKKALITLTTGVAFAMATGMASAAMIMIDDLLEGGPGVTISPDILSVSVTNNSESLFITGVLFVPAGTSTFPAGSLLGVLLVEVPTQPGEAPIPSDYVNVVIGPEMLTPLGIIQNFVLNFLSDGAPGFASTVANLPAGTPMLFETGGFQDLSTVLNTGAFHILVRSDAESVPEPVTLTLVALGLLGIVASRRITG